MPKRKGLPSSPDERTTKRTHLLVSSQQTAQFEGNLRSHDPVRASLSHHLLLPSSSTRTTHDRNMPDAEGEHTTGLKITADPPSFPDGPLIDDKLQWKLKVSAQRTPRFLFRAWRFNEDRTVIDTPDSITPRAFHDHDCPPSMFDVPKRVLANDALDDLRGKSHARLFSDWTHSLHAALEKAQELTAEATTGTYGTHIGVIDTKRLPAYITILHTSALGMIDKRIPRVPTVKHKFLAYGVIKGGAYKAVAFEPLLGKGRNWLTCPNDELANVRTEVALAKRFGQLFGDAFELPVTAMLLAGYSHNGDVLKDEKRAAFLVKALEKYAVPLDWVRDMTITADQACTARHKDVIRTRHLLRALVEQQYGAAACEEAKNANALSQLPELFGVRASILDSEWEFPGSDSDDSTSTEDSEDYVEPIPPGKMDEKTKRQLQEAMRKTPRYLFRCWNDSDRPSGGHKDLNTVDAITPLAFSRGEGATSIYHLSRNSLTEMVVGHLRGYPVATQLSSWAASLPVACGFARAIPKTCYISVIDTRTLPDQNVILHVPSMSFLSPTCAGMHHEYLAHGVIQGRAHRVVSLDMIRRFDLNAMRVWKSAAHYGLPAPKRQITQITAAQVREAREVGEMYGGNFVAPVTVALLCLKQRDPDFWRSGLIPELATVNAGLADCEVPRELCQDATILTDIVYTTEYPDVEQMIRLLRALVDYRHGRGARNRSRSRPRSPSAPNMHARADQSGVAGGVRWKDGRTDGHGGEEEHRGRRRARSLAEVREFTTEEEYIP